MARRNGGDAELQQRTVARARERFPDAHIAPCSIPPRKGHERDQTSANDATIGVMVIITLLALSRRSNNVQYIDTFSTLAPKAVVQNQLFSNTYPAGVHYSKAGKQQVISRITAGVTSKEKLDNQKAKRPYKQKSSKSPHGASDKLKKKSPLSEDDAGCDTDTGSDSALS